MVASEATARKSVEVRILPGALDISTKSRSTGWARDARGCFALEVLTAAHDLGKIGGQERYLAGALVAKNPLLKVWDSVSTVCLVEDDLDAQVVLKMVLERRGFEVFATDDGQAMFDRLCDGLKPSVILLDLNLARMSGFEIYQTLQSHPRLAKIPVILVTGSPPQHRVGLESVPTLRKPIETHELFFMIDRVIGR